MARTPQLGVTIIEVMIAFAVLGVLTTLAAPSLQKVVAKQRLRSAAYDLVSDLTLARSEAIKRGTPVVLEPLTAKQWATGWRLRNEADSAILAQHPALVSVGLNKQPDTVRFDAAAQITSDTTKPFELTDNNGNTRCIQLDPLGRAKSTTGACAP